jgi:hypothetical protein
MSADIQTVEVTGIDAESRQMEMLAKLAAQKLTEHYPNHVWMVGWAPGMTLVIKYMGADARYGYTVDAAKAASISELEKAVVMGGGEMLERLGMKRGAWDGELPNQQYAGIKDVT